MKSYALMAVAALIAGAPAGAAVIVTDYALNFTAGTAIVAPVTQTAPGEYQDRFTFTTTQQMTFSGSLSTQRLFNLAGNIVSDLDFGNTLPVDGVHLNGTYFLLASGGSDALEVQDLPTTFIDAGTHVLTVNYTVRTASATNGATYAGPVFLAPAAPIPEPASWAMMIAGMGTVGGMMRRRGKAAKISFA